MELLRKELVEVLDINLDTIKLLVQKSNRFYRMTRIPKRRGGYRVIYQPSPIIKMIQHYIVEQYFEKCNISIYATAYIKGKSIKDNIIPHMSNVHFLFIDITDFFGSINYDNMKKILLNQEILSGFDEHSIEDILKLCTHNRKLAQGAVSSPILSNIYMYELDISIAKLVNQLPDGKYTRYSDDITISSSSHIPYDLLNQISLLFTRVNLRVNREKSYFCSNMQNVQITGIRIINKKKISLHTKNKKRIKNMVFHKLKNFDSSDETTNQILGHLNYLQNIDPKYYNKIQKKYSNENITTVQRLKDIESNTH